MKNLPNDKLFRQYAPPLQWEAGSCHTYYLAPSSRKAKDKVYHHHFRGLEKELLFTQAIFHSFVQPGTCYKQSKAPWLSIEYLRAGKLFFKQNGRAYRMDPQEIFLMQPDAENEFVAASDEPCEKFSLSVCGPLLAVTLEQSGLSKIDILQNVDGKRFEALFNEFKTLEGKFGKEDFRRNSALSYESLMFLRSPEHEGSIPERLEMLRDYMESHLNESPNLEKLAKQYGYSRTYVIKHFKRFFGITPHQWLIQMRMNKAAKLLLGSPHSSIKEIAAELGYSNSMNFSSEFKRNFNVSPRLYRHSELR